MGKEPVERPYHENSEWDYQMNVKLLRPSSCVPEYATPNSSCFDFFIRESYSASEWKPVEIEVLDSDSEDATVSKIVSAYRLDVPLGIAAEVPPEYTLDLFSRSGHGKKYGCTLVNSVGIIDSDYRGEITAMLVSFTPFDIEPNTQTGRVAVCQGRLVHTPKVYFDVVDDLSVTSRGTGGFGHTGM